MLELVTVPQTTAAKWACCICEQMLIRTLLGLWERYTIPRFQERVPPDKFRPKGVVQLNLMMGLLDSAQQFKHPAKEGEARFYHFAGMLQLPR